MAWGIRSRSTDLGLLAALLLACSSFTASTPSPEDGHLAQDAAPPDGGGGLTLDATSPPSETFCAPRSAARWCFDFESGELGTWRGARWRDNLQLPGTLQLDRGAVLSTVPGWTTDAQAGRANVFLDASFTSTLGFEWSFSAEEMGDGGYALIAEILESPALSGRVTVYAIGDRIRFETTNDVEIATVAKPARYPVRFRLDLRRSNDDVLLDITMGTEHPKSGYAISPWSSSETRVGFGIGQVDGTRNDPKGRRFRYDDVLVDSN
ncbi:MAG: hypothetical protein U0270_43265 [Labilithrix sp.]